MAKVLTISKNDSPETIKEKIRKWNEKSFISGNSFNAQKLTGKIMSYGNGLDYQRRLRDEWR